MAQQNLYTVPDETKQIFKKFRTSTARIDTLQAHIVTIEKKNDHAIVVETESPITEIDELQEELPDAVPRFILLSKLKVTSDGRKTNPFIMIYYRPPTTTQQNRMTFAGAVELVRNEAGVQRVVEIEDTEELDDLDDLI